MRKPKTLQEAYDSCIADGFIHPIAGINGEKIISLAENAKIHCRSAEIIVKALDSKAKEWIDVYTLYYEALRTYAEALLLFEQVESPNHQCLFATLCLKYPQLELDWDFLETLRTKRNGINYYGEQITYQDWKSIEIQLKLYISTLQQEVEQHLRGIP